MDSQFELNEITEVEVELTNYCNAKCIACPRETLTVEKGFMNDSTFYEIVDHYEQYRKQIKINDYYDNKYPTITLAGMGEPLMHPSIVEFVQYATDKSFHVDMFTNASLLTDILGQELLEAGLKSVYISFWGIEKNEYEAAMGLDYIKTLKNVEVFIKKANNFDCKVKICWVDSNLITSSSKSIKKFWNLRGVEVDDENEAWNRAGLLDNNALFNNLNAGFLPDFNKEIWCSQMYFADTITWKGELIICSCDYYNNNHIYGHRSCLTTNDVLHIKNELLKINIPHMCKNCKKPDRNYIWGTEPIDNIVDENLRELYEYGN